LVCRFTPCNCTASAGNLPTSVALLGNTVSWKPSPTEQLAAHFTMRLLEAAGLPAGVINMLPGDGIAVSEVALTDPDLAGIHFTGSTGTFQLLWRTVGENIGRYRSYPRIVGETGGTVVAGGTADDSEGWFVRPTVVECTDPSHEVFTTEYFGPILGVHVYDDERFEDVVGQAESAAPYALTGSVFANDRRVIEWTAQ